MFNITRNVSLGNSIKILKSMDIGDSFKINKVNVIRTKEGWMAGKSFYNMASETLIAIYYNQL